MDGVTKEFRTNDRNSSMKIRTRRCHTPSTHSATVGVIFSDQTLRIIAGEVGHEEKAIGSRPFNCVGGHSGNSDNLYNTFTTL